MTALQRLRHEEEGWTLVELLVAMTLVVVVGAIVVSSVTAAYSATRRGQDRVAALNELQDGMERMSREARAAIALHGTDADELVADVCRGGDRLRMTYALDDTSAQVRETVEVYTATGTDVRRDVPAFMERVEGGEPTFRYLDGDGEETAEPDEVRRIEIVLVRDLPEDSEIEVHTSALLRNDLTQLPPIAMSSPCS